MEQEEQKPDPIKLAEKLRKEHSEKLAKNLASLGKSSLENDSKKEISAEESNTFTQKDFDRHEFDPETVPYSKDKYKDGVVHDEDVGKKKLEAKKAKKIPENSKESRSDNDAKDSAEKKAEKEKEAQERAEKIEELKQEVEKIRKEYLEADYKRKGAFKRLGNFFGKVFKEKEEKNLENDQEIAWYRAYYDDALMNYKNALLEDAKLKGASDEELLDIAKIFQVEANINIADINHQVKVENQEGRFSGFIKEHSMELVQRYKKLSLAKKIAIGAAFGGAALGAGYIGAAAVGAVGSAVAARRAFLALVTGTTTSLAFEAMGKKKTEENIEKGMSSLEEKMMKLTEEEKFKLINEIIGNDIKDEDNNINKIKNKNLRHLAYGVAAGAATMLLPKITRAFSEKTGAGEWAKEHIFGKTVQQEIPGAGKIAPEAITDAEKPAAGQIPENNIPEKTIEKAETVLEVQKGSSLEGSIIQHLKGHPELIEKYNELNGGRSFNAGQIAHRMALDYADKYPESFPQGPPSLVHEGTGIRMNLETMEIEDIQSEEKIGYLPENDTDSKIRPEEMKTPSFEENQQEIKAGDADAEKVFDTDQGPRNKIIEDIGNKEEEINRIEEQPASRYSHNTNNPLQHADDIEKLKGSQRELWEKLMQEDTASEVARNIKKEIAISNPENWKRVKDLTFDQIRDADVSNDVKNNIAKVYRTYRTVFGKESMPKNEETVAKWTERLARLLIKNK